MAEIYSLSSLEEQDLVAKHVPEPMACHVAWKRDDVLELSLMSQPEDVDKRRSATAEGAMLIQSQRSFCPSGMSPQVSSLWPSFPSLLGKQRKEAGAALTATASVTPALSLPHLSLPDLSGMRPWPDCPSSSAGACNSCPNILLCFCFPLSYVHRLLAL